MDHLLQIADHTENKYKPVVDYGAWRVAYYNNTEDQVNSFAYTERHMETDEVFVLVAGHCKLIISETGYDNFTVIPMEPLKIYNVRSAAYHQVSLQPGCRLLIVENVDTSAQNTRYCYLTAEQKQELTRLLDQTSFE